MPFCEIGLIFIFSCACMREIMAYLNYVSRSLHKGDKSASTKHTKRKYFKRQRVGLPRTINVAASLHYAASAVLV